MSISFYPSVTQKRAGERPVTVRYGEKQVTVKCWVCSGTGKEEAYVGKPGDGPSLVDCEYCGGKGKRLEWQGEGPEMNVSNTNAFVILNFLGIEEDYAGTIPNASLQKLLMKMYQTKTADQTGIEYPGRITGGNKRRVVDKDPETGLDRISTKSDGPTLYHMGITNRQANTYIDNLIKIFEFARDAGVDVTWA